MINPYYVKKTDATTDGPIGIGLCTVDDYTKTPYTWIQVGGFCPNVKAQVTNVSGTISAGESLSCTTTAGVLTGTTTSAHNKGTIALDAMSNGESGTVPAKLIY